MIAASKSNKLAEWFKQSNINKFILVAKIFTELFTEFIQLKMMRNQVETQRKVPIDFNSEKFYTLCA